MMMLLRRMVPAPMQLWIKSYLHARRRARISRGPKISEAELGQILGQRLQVRRGDLVFVHSSTDNLNLGFSPFRLLPLLLETVGPEGTLLFPTYPRLGSAEFLRRDEVFDARSTPSYMGLLTELARRHPGAVRSLHPTKSVCAIGPLAKELTADHQRSPYPYSACSPYYKIIAHGGKIIGLGLTTGKLSFTHCVDDALGAEFPVAPYLPTCFRARCVDGTGQQCIVDTYAHDMRQMVHDVPRFVRRHIAPETCSELTIGSASFFLAHSRPLFEQMMQLARRGITIYPRRVYKRA